MGGGKWEVGDGRWDMGDGDMKWSLITRRWDSRVQAEVKSEDRGEGNMDLVTKATYRERVFLRGK